MTFATPKSSTLHAPSSSRTGSAARRRDDDRRRGAIDVAKPCAWCRPSHACARTPRRSAGAASRGVALEHEAQSTPSRYSIARNSSPSSSPSSNTWHTFGCDSCAAMRPSSRNISTKWRVVGEVRQDALDREQLREPAGAARARHEQLRHATDAELERAARSGRASREACHARDLAHLGVRREHDARAAAAGRALDHARTGEPGVDEIAPAPADQHVDLRPADLGLARPHDRAHHVVGDELARALPSGGRSRAIRRSNRRSAR